MSNARAGLGSIGGASQSCGDSDVAVGVKPQTAAWYPAVARLQGWEGKVVLRAVITADGNLADVKVQKSWGHEALDEAAMESMRQACPLP